MLFLYVVVGHLAIKTPGGEPMFQKPPHEQEKAGRMFLLWFLVALNYGVVMKGNILQDLCMYVILTYTYICQTNEPNLVKYTWILWVCWSKKQPTYEALTNDERGQQQSAKGILLGFLDVRVG